ncbi:MFS transporter [Dyella amyloliquefaciens]|uniref:MFS transporter n=1 Tax=Dyella amyloliquefaciens TaxID=1770545 RepID=UPI00102E2B0C|nr:MFS transporter [Dyella amyloliquefaciens]
MHTQADTEIRGSRLTLRIVQIVCFTFLAYLVIGMQLAVLPPFVHDNLGMGAVVAGLVISTQYVATLLSRGFAGRTSDTAGPKRAAWIGLLACAASGLLMIGAALLRAWPMASLGTMLVARLALGMGESCVATGCIMWGIGRVGSEHTAKVISWNGIATYGALAVGAPLGVVLVAMGGFVMIGVSGVALMLLALLLAWRRPPVHVEAGERLPMHHVFGRVAPYGMGLALGSVGFGVIATFITLYYASQGWVGAAPTLSAFGVCFVGVRLVLGWTIAHFGGYRVALGSLLIEAIGLMVLASASHAGVAMLGASLCGIGFSLVFPSLGVVAVERVSVSNRGAALAAYSVFIDVALGVTGPLGGWIASGGRYGPMFVVAAALSLAAALLTATLYVGYGSKLRG